MHDIDRTQREFESAMYEMQPEYFEYSNEANEWGEQEGEAYSQEAWHEIPTGETWQEAEQYEGENYEYQGENYAYEGENNEYQGEGYEYQGENYEYQGEGENYEFQGEGESYEYPINEAEEMEMAAELLGIANEYELDQFFGKLFKKVSQAVGKAINSPLGQALGGALKPLVKQVLPVAGGALGAMVGGPLGAQLGNQVTSAAGRLFGLELEGLSGEDREYEMSRRFVRFATTAARNALRAPRHFRPRHIARRSLIEAMRRMAPSLRRAYCNCPTYTPMVAPDDATFPEPIPAPALPPPTDAAAAAPAGAEGQGEYGNYGRYRQYGQSYGQSYGQYGSNGSQRGTWVRQGRRIILFGA